MNTNPNMVPTLLSWLFTVWSFSHLFMLEKVSRMFFSTASLKTWNLKNVTLFGWAKIGHLSKMVTLQRWIFKVVTPGLIELYWIICSLNKTLVGWARVVAWGKWPHFQGGHIPRFHCILQVLLGEWVEFCRSISLCNVTADHCKFSSRFLSYVTCTIPCKLPLWFPLRQSLSDIKLSIFCCWSKTWQGVEMRQIRQITPKMGK